jgi:hypothetical protein
MGGLWQAGGVSGSTRKEEKNYLPLLHVQGKEKGEQCRSKRHCSAPFFFLHETAPFYEKRVVSFKGGASILFSN